MYVVDRVEPVLQSSRCTDFLFCGFESLEGKVLFFRLFTEFLFPASFSLRWRWGGSMAYGMVLWFCKIRE